MVETRRKKARRVGGRSSGRRTAVLELRTRLDAAEARYRALTEKLPLTTYVSALDVQGAFTYVSPQVEALLGFAPEEWTSDRRLWLNRLHPGDTARVLPLLVRAHQGGRPFVAEYRLLDRAGRSRWIHDESHVVRDEGGRPLLIQGTWSEITKHKDLERESASRGRDLAASKAELEQLVSVTSHELNAPLRRIINLADLLGRRSRGRLGDEAEGMIERIARSATDMARLVAGLKTFVETGQDRPEARPVDLASVAADVLRQLEPQVKEASAEVTVDPLPTVAADAASAMVLLKNLLDNALKFRGARPARVHLSAARAGDHWEISVRDHGIGIDPRQLERVFSVFARLHPSERYPGVGLGLAVCKRIVESYGGRIRVESEPREGSTFRFTLPAPELPA